MMVAAMIAWQVFACGAILGIACLGTRRIRRKYDAINERLRQELERSRADRLDEPEAEPEPAESHSVGA